MSRPSISSPPSSLSQLPWIERIKHICLSVQFIWLIGHVLLVLGLPYFIYSRNEKAYYRAVFGTMMSYGVVLWRRYKNEVGTKGIKEILMKLAKDVNAQYFILSLTFYMGSKPFIAVLIPYFSFSIFHVLSYFRESLLPALSPSYRFPSDNNAGFLKSFDKYNDNLIKKTIQPKAVELASLWECSVTPIWLLIQCLLFRQNILMLIVYFQFLLFRYVTSLTTRASFAKIRAKGDQLLLPHLQSPSVLGKIANGYVSARNYLISFSEKFDVYFPEARRSSTSVHPHSQ